MSGRDILDFIAPVLNKIEDALFWLTPNGGTWPLRMIYKTRKFLSEGRNRRLLRKAARAWAKSPTIQSEDYFSSDDLGVDLGDEILAVAVQYKYKPRSLMYGHDNNG